MSPAGRAVGWLGNVGDAMSRKFVLLSPGTRVEDALIWSEGRGAAWGVVVEDGRVVGGVAVSDLAAAGMSRRGRRRRGGALRRARARSAARRRCEHDRDAGGSGRVADRRAPQDGRCWSRSSDRRRGRRPAGWGDLATRSDRGALARCLPRPRPDPRPRRSGVTRCRAVTFTRRRTPWRHRRSPSWWRPEASPRRPRLSSPPSCSVWSPELVYGFVYVRPTPGPSRGSERGQAVVTGAAQIGGVVGASEHEDGSTVTANTSEPSPRCRAFAARSSSDRSRPGPGREVLKCPAGPRSPARPRDAACGGRPRRSAPRAGPDAPGRTTPPRSTGRARSRARCRRCGTRRLR